MQTKGSDNFQQSNNTESKISQEAGAFDKQILERVQHGHVPDLRHAERNEWFYNNVWRDPEFVKMSFGENLDFLNQYLYPNSKVLEVGCGPGHLSLELARYGHDITGVDLSPECIKVAQKTAANNVHNENFGSLKYYCGDFIKLNLPENSFDGVLFYGSLSHFPNIDSPLKHVCRLLVPQGRILVWDTSVDLYTKEDAALLYFIRALLSFTGHYYREEEIALDPQQLENLIDQTLNELRYVDETGNNVQSPNDNSQTYQTMMTTFNKMFIQLAFCWESSFYRNVIGGIRFQHQEEERTIARLIKQMEQYLVQHGRLNPAFFYYVGKKVDGSGLANSEV